MTYWGSAKSLRWLRDERIRGAHDWEGLCAGLAATAAGFSSSGANANQWANSIRKAIRRQGPAPAGKLELWLGGEYGHVGWTLGRGVLLCNKPDGSVGRMAESYYQNIGPSFWVDPDKYPEVFKLCQGVNTDRVVLKHPVPPVLPPPPAVKTLHWPLVPGNDYRRIVDVKRAFDWPNLTEHYGRDIERRVRKFEKNHPEYGPANGLIGPNEYQAIVTRGK